MYESSKELPSNVLFDEISDQPKCLQHALTDLKLCNKAGNTDEVHFKLDTGASGNLLPLKNYLELFPKTSVKDLSSTVNPSVQLQKVNKSVIKHLGTVGFCITHSNHTHTCLFYVVQTNAILFWVCQILCDMVCFLSIVEFQKTGKEPVICSITTKMTI